jgi:Skp family chaperone for outer membrane proteins
VTKSIFAIVCAASFACGAMPAVAQNTTAPQGFVPVVAVVDLPLLMQNHLRFKAKQEELKRQIQGAEEMVKGDQKAIEEQAKLMQTFRPNTPDYKTAEEQLAKMNADLQLKVQIQKRNFAEFRTKAFAEVQDEVANYVYHYAVSQGILVVLNYNGEEVDANNPQSVMQALYNPVLYKHPASDITQQILQMINQQLPVNPRPRPTAAPQPNGVNTADGNAVNPPVNR